MRAGNCRDIIEKTKFENERSYFTLVAHYFDCAQNVKGFACDPSVFLRRATTHTGWCVVKRTKRTNERGRRDANDAVCDRCAGSGGGGRRGTRMTRITRSLGGSERNPAAA